jgi:hypothetical protein
MTINNKIIPIINFKGIVYTIYDLGCSNPNEAITPVIVINTMKSVATYFTVLLLE